MEAPWFWVITTEVLSPLWLTDRGYAVSREHALAHFRARWTLSDLVCHRVADLPLPDDAFVHRSLRSMQRANLGHLEQSKRREADLLAMRQVLRSPLNNCQQEPREY